MSSKVKSAKRCLKHLIRASRITPEMRVAHFMKSKKVNDQLIEIVEMSRLNQLETHIFTALATFQNLMEYEDMNGANTSLSSDESSEEEEEESSVVSYDFYLFIVRKHINDSPSCEPMGK